jgi:hypothetical protein
MTRAIIVTWTVMDGQVARWYTSPAAAEFSDPLITASRRGVIGGPSALLTPDLFAEAWAAHLRLASGRPVDDIATHKRFLGGAITPVDAEPVQEPTG